MMPFRGKTAQFIVYKMNREILEIVSDSKRLHPLCISVLIKLGLACDGKLILN